MSILVELPEKQYAPKVFADFVPGAGFNLKTARAMAWMSQLAYETRFPDKIKRIATGWELGDVRVRSSPPRVRSRCRTRTPCWPQQRTP